MPSGRPFCTTSAVKRFKRQGVRVGGWVGLRTEEAHRRTSNHCLQIQISSPPDLQTVACSSSNGWMFMYGHFLEVRFIVWNLFVLLGSKGWMVWEQRIRVPPALSASTRFGLVLVEVCVSTRARTSFRKLSLISVTGSPILLLLDCVRFCYHHTPYIWD